MRKYIIICSTNINGPELYEELSMVLNSCTAIDSWSIDLTDIDKVLRIETTEDLGIYLETRLVPSGIDCKVMESFINKL